MKGVNWMKKFLNRGMSLLLALSLLVGMMTVGASAIDDNVTAPDPKLQTAFTVQFTFNDAIFGALEATLTVDTEAETYKLYYEHSFGATDVQGWYIPNGEEMIVGVTSGVDGVFLTEDAVVEAVAPELLKLYRDNGLSTERKEYDPATCEHRWLDGVCAACGTVCEHPEMTDGVCPTCGYVCDHADHDKDSLICNICGKRGHHTFVDGVCTGCGATTSYATDLESISGLLAPANQQGTIEKITYTTYQYDETGNRGEAFENSAYIYLPYNYDPDQQYNILYLMHGGGGVAESWLIQDAPETPNLLDNMIASGYCEPTIVVTPTFNKNSVYVYGYELMNDLIPVVEAKYATYANGDVTPENLKATRAHRAYAGLSMGSILSWNAILKYSTDYFGYVGSYSAGPDAGSDDVCMELVDEIAASLKASGNEIYYWFNANGLRDMAHDPHLFSYYYMVETYPELFQDGVNSSWIDYLDGQHDWPWWQLDLYNTMQVFFKVNMPEEETKPDQPSTEPDQPGEEPDQSGTEPNQPGAEPDQPGTESNQPNATVNHAPKTGDTSNVALCVTLVLLSLSGIAALCWKKTGLLKKRNKS